MCLVGLAKQVLLGYGIELKFLETNNGLKVVSEHFEEFCKLQGGKHSGYTCSRLWWRKLSLRWSLLLVRLEEDNQH
jgi:hypothetical protein